MASVTGERPRTRTPRRFLPPSPGLAEPYRLTPQTAMRIAVLGAVACGVFGVLFFRLWALQVLSGDRYRNAALDNQVRTRRLAAPRGLILDRNGRPLVTNVAGSAIVLWPADLPKKGRYVELKRLSRIVKVPVAEMARKIRERRNDLLDPVVVKQGVHEDQVYYVKEHQLLFPGVAVEETYIRHYPYQALASQILGYDGEITQQQLDRQNGSGYLPGDMIGQSGVEASYDSYLRGRPGLAQLRVDSLGRPISFRTQRLPQPGDALRLTIDVDLQRAAERALRNGILLAQSQGHWQARGGAIVALDPRDGSVLALASSPTYQPGLYAGRRETKKLAKAGLLPSTAAARNFPAVDRVTQGVYPAGSTFKPVTALAALEEHLITPLQTLDCTGSIKIAHQRFKNWDPFVSQPMNMATALAASCDTYFYQLGKKFYDLPRDRGQPLQQWASRFGFGKPTGIDLGGELSGLLPTIGWRHRTYTKKTDPGNWQIDRLWKPGDSVQLAIGQKDLQVTPLQMARFYALIANGGKLVTPHVAQDVEQTGAAGAATPLRLFAPAPPRQLNIDPKALEDVRTGLFEATHASFGTTQSVFGNYAIPIAGKTGTAEKYVGEYGRLLDQSWWCGYGPYGKPTIVVCALIENGGHGGTAAAPTALQVFERYFGIKAPSAVVGNSD